MTSAPPQTEISKAFLSHSSLDKTFVEAVAVRLGRVQVVFDRWCFESGDLFIKAIPDALQRTELFVLFASKASLRSFWVQLELDHAELLLASSVLRKAVVFIIDDELNHSDLPKWMQNGLVRRYSSPNAVAREIQSMIDTLRGVKQKDYFFGRDQLMRDFTELLYPSAGNLPPNILVVSGLWGMGRKTFARRVLEDRLSLRPGPTFLLRKGDDLATLHLAALLDTRPLAPKDEIAKEVGAFRAASLSDKAAETARLLAVSGEYNVAPFIIDDGALLESDGSYSAEGSLLLKEIRAIPQLTVVFVQPRLAKLTASVISNLGICSTRVPPLDPESSRQFLQRRFIDNKIGASKEQIAELITYLNGYPPVFNMATTYAREYGLPVLLQNKAALTSFQQQEFADFLQNVNLSNSEWGVLRILASGVNLPVEGLMVATGQPSEKIVDAVQRLVDLCLVLNDGGTLAATGPLVYAVRAAKGDILPQEYALISKNLKAAFWDTASGLPEYGILDATISFLLRSDEPDLKDFKQIVVPSMLLRTARYQYQKGGYDSWLAAKKLLDILLELDPKNVKALSLLTRIYTRLRRIGDAQEVLKQLKTLKAPDVHLLEGFLLWKQRHFSQAVPHYENALRLGQEAVEIYHGLATCLFRLKRLDEAKKVLRKGLIGKARDIVLLVDLAAQIAIDKGELPEAEQFVEQLRRLKADTDYHHRFATLLIAKNKSAEAVPHARKASEGPKARFENITTYINTLIEVRRFPEAEKALDKIDEDFRREDDRKDVRLGLRCKFLLRQGNWRQSEPLWAELSDAGSPIRAALRKEMLQQKTADKRTSLSERNEANLELLSLTAALSLDNLLFSDSPDVEDSI